jgi:hypothetical protein
MNISAAALFMLSLAGSLFGQETARLSGFVWDSSASLVPDASITAISEETGFRRIDRSGADGGYQLAYLNPGHYKITVRRQGFHTMVQFGLKLDAAQSAREDFHLQIGSVEEAITVTGGPVVFNAEDASLSTLVGRNWIEHLPLDGRGVLTLMELAPGSIITPATEGEAGQFSINGQRPNTNYFTVDGVSANTGVNGRGLPAQIPGGSLPNMTAFGSFHELASIESLDEFRLQTSTVTPEYGRSPGGQIELSSRSGSNDFHGLLFDAFRNEALDAKDWFRNREGAPRLPLRFQDFGGTFGGPIHRNRTFFFLSYEGLRLQQPYTWQTTVPSITARASAPPLIQPILNAFPAPNGADLGGSVAAWTGSSSRPSTFDGGSVRIDHALSSRLLLFGRYTQTPSSTQFRSIDINAMRIGSSSLTVGINAIFSPAAINQVRVNRTATTGDSVWGDATEQSTGCYVDAILFGANAACASFYRFSIGGISQLDAGTDGRNRQNQWNLVDSAQLRHGAHQFRFGAEYRRLTMARDAPQTSETINAVSVQALMNSIYSVAVSQALQQNTSITELSAFAEDSWRLSPRLSLTYGVRWELEPSPLTPRPPGGYGPPPTVPSSTIPIWHTSYTDFAPHAGIAYRLTDDGRTILRAGFGLYFDPDFGAQTDGINGGPYNAWQFNSVGSPVDTSPPPVTLITYGFAKGLRLPKTWEWNATVERALTLNDVLSIGDVGSAGRNLLRREVGSNSSAILEIVNTTNNGESDYNSFQAQYRRHLTRGLQALVSYAWSHSLDNGSADSAIFWAPAPNSAANDWASSDFDVRHSFTSALSFKPSFRGRIFASWSLDGIFRARTGFPINVLNAETVVGLNFANAFRPDVAAGVPLWIENASFPGGRALNPAAFLSVDSTQGTLGRNAIRGFGMSQLDLAFRRTFALTEKSSLEVRAEAFNLLNQAAFADPVRFLSNPLFGQSTSMLNLMLGSGTPGSGLTPAFQVGGPRSVQLVVRLHF